MAIKRGKIKDKKLIFQGSAEGLLFWLLVAPPIGVSWLIFNMKIMEINTDREGEIKSFKHIS